MRKIREIIFRTNIRLLTLIPMILGLSILIIINLGYEYITHMSLPEPFRIALLVLACIVSSFSGIFQIIRKETVTPYLIRGNEVVAVINGTLTIVFFVILLIYLVMSSFL